MHIRGFAPYGTIGTKVGRAQCIEEQRKNTEMMDHSFAKETRWLQPFLQNHALSLEVLAAETWSAKHWAGKLNLKMSAQKHTINAAEVRAAVESCRH